MAKDKEKEATSKFIFDRSIAQSKYLVKGLPVHTSDSKAERTYEETIEDVEKADLLDERKDLITTKMKAKKDAIRKQGEPNPKRWTVDPETGRIDVDEEGGEYTQKEAMVVSASIKGKSGQYDAAIALITAAKALAPEKENQSKVAEKPKEFYVDPETGIILKDAENGEYTLSEARTISQSMKKISQPEQGQTPGAYVDPEGNVHELKPGQPIVVQRVLKEQGKTYIMTPEGDVVEQEAGKPLVIKIQSPAGNSNLTPMMPFPVFGSDGQPVFDKDGRPVYANLEPMMRWMGFQSEQKRANERHQTLMGLAQTMKENIPDGIQAITKAAQETQKSGGAQPQEASPQLETFICGNCKTPFSAPAGWAGQPIRCPNPQCGREYTSEELMA